MHQNKMKQDKRLTKDRFLRQTSSLSEMLGLYTHSQDWIYYIQLDEEENKVVF